MSTEVKPTDWDAEDNRWEPTPSGSGSGLPPYTSADKGKVLTIGEGEGGETVVIVPEQSVTTAYSSYMTKYMASVEIEDVSQPSADYTYTMTINGTDHPVVINGWQYWTSDHKYGIMPNIPDGTSWVFIVANAEAAGTYTVSLTRSVPSVEPKWEEASGGGGGVKIVELVQNTDTDNNACDALIKYNNNVLTSYEAVAAFITENPAIIAILSGLSSYNVMLPTRSTIVEGDLSAYYLFSVNGNQMSAGWTTR